MMPHYQAGLWLTNFFIGVSMNEPTVSGEENLPPPGQRTLYVCNHDDIIREPGITNWQLHRLGRPLAYIMVGKNLNNLTNQILLHLAPIRIIPRGEGTGGQTAAIMQEELERGHDIWVAQGKGRTKDGSHRTHPNLLYNLANQYHTSIDDFIKQVAVVPVAVSAEIDPAATFLARSEYDKMKLSRGEAPRKPSTFHDIRVGFFGHKGQAHISFGPRLEGRFSSREDAAEEIDRFIMGNYKCYPTHKAAYKERSRHPFADWKRAPVNPDEINNDPLQEQVRRTDEECRPLLVARYAMAVYERRIINS